MVLGIGLDVIEVDRIKNAIEKRPDAFLKRIFIEEEIQYCSNFNDSAVRFAGRFAAKEAVAKALGSGFGEQLSPLDIGIKNNPQGKPEVFLSEKVQALFNFPHILLSISHIKNVAVAVAIWQK